MGMGSPAVQQLVAVRVAGLCRVKWMALQWAAERVERQSRRRVAPANVLAEGGALRPARLFCLLFSITHTPVQKPSACSKQQSTSPKLPCLHEPSTQPASTPAGPGGLQQHHNQCCPHQGPAPAARRRRPAPLAAARQCRRRPPLSVAARRCCRGHMQARWAALKWAAYVTTYPTTCTTRPAPPASSPGASTRTDRCGWRPGRLVASCIVAATASHRHSTLPVSPACAHLLPTLPCPAVRPGVRARRRGGQQCAAAQSGGGCPRNALPRARLWLFPAGGGQPQHTGHRRRRRHHHLGAL